MPTTAPRVFLSCVSREWVRIRDGDRNMDETAPALRRCVRKTLSRLESARWKLHYIQGNCAAVIHLVGRATGAAPRPSSVTDFLHRPWGHFERITELQNLNRDILMSLSYTQWEAVLAICSDVKLFIYPISPDAPMAPGLSKIRRRS